MPFRTKIWQSIRPVGPVDYVFHLAGNASPHFINADPVGIMKCNLMGTMNVLESARAWQTKKVIFASTREVYGKNEDVELLDEQAYGTLDPLDDRSCYPESKRAAVRAFIYVTDAVVGMFAVLFKGETANAYNLANETEPVSIKELANILAAQRKLQVVVSEGDRKGYCAYRRTALDTSAIVQLGWKPEVCLEEGIGRVLQFHND